MEVGGEGDYIPIIEVTTRMMASGESHFNVS